MNRLFLILLCAVCLIPACKKSNSQSIIDACPIDTLVADQYIHDAQELLYTRILSGQPVAGSNQALFNQTELNRILSAIQSVYALASPERDSVFVRYQIHAFKSYLLNSLVLGVDINAPEIKNLISGKATGNAAFDALVNQYHFVYESSLPPNANLPYLTLNSADWYNMKVLLSRFSSFSFIKNATVNGLAGDGNNITYQTQGTNRILDFSHGYNDCPSGCGSRAHWVFQVDDMCQASFLKTYDGPYTPIN